MKLFLKQQLTFGVVACIVCITVMIHQSMAQTLPPIQLDRPDQTECPFITPKNYIQIEHGITMENIRNNQSI
ncbi:MAG: hypothetical protein KJS45_10675, partial [Bacteroidetes bacterium]|nr:hypothetical protein [Bacteroidota bacterium]